MQYSIYHSSVAMLWFLFYFTNGQVYYKGPLGKATPVSVTPEMERVKKNQEIISSASPLSHFVSCFRLMNNLGFLYGDYSYLTHEF